MRRSLKDGAFLTLMVPPRSFEQARRELEGRFSLRAVDGDRVIIDALRDTAKRARVDWSLVLRADATPANGDWSKLLMLVHRAMPKVEEQLFVPDATVLLLDAGLLARYDNLDLLERLRDRVRRPGGPGGLSLPPPGQQPLIDAKAVPLSSPSQRVLVPDGWVEHRHWPTPDGRPPVIDRTAFLADARSWPATEKDLGPRCDGMPGWAGPSRPVPQGEDAGRTGQPWSGGPTPSPSRPVAWVLSCVFVRFLEDNRLIDPPKRPAPASG